ncbi:MAG: type I glyceraldehyde-3-phosphate dehydrogenase [Deltaproteobacteria bacterium]|nr:MAG: type I glyceraldehyde-3-phosphate dehydrogenase [Deltaproteobacteria bacterium]
MSKIRIAINGFGRIGRLAARTVLDRNDLELVAINDLADNAALTYLFKNDSVQGRFNRDVHLEGDVVYVDGKAIAMTEHRDPMACKWGEQGVDIVLECTGVFLTREKAQPHFDSGAKKVLLSAPAKDKGIKTVVMGVNHDTLDANETLISNASCTTNAVAPPLKALHDAFGVVNGVLNTVHAYTISQSLLDSPVKKDVRASRAAALNLVPSTTGAAKAVGLVIPELLGKLDGMSIRTPNPTGSIADLTMLFAKEPSIEEAHAVLAAYAEKNPNVMWFSNDDLVSTDIVGQRFSSVIDSKMTMKVGPMLKILSWYDNEMGYATRLVDLAEYVSSL